MKNGFFHIFFAFGQVKSERKKGFNVQQQGLERYSFAEYFVFALSGLLAIFIFQDKTAPKSLPSRTW